MALHEICSAKQPNGCNRAAFFSGITILLASPASTGQSVTTLVRAGTSPKYSHQTTRVTTFAVSVRKNLYAYQSKWYQTFQNAGDSYRLSHLPNGTSYVWSYLLAP